MRRLQMDELHAVSGGWFWIAFAGSFYGGMKQYNYANCIKASAVMDGLIFTSAMGSMGLGILGPLALGAMIGATEGMLGYLVGSQYANAPRRETV